MMIIRPLTMVTLIAALAATPLSAQSTFDQVDPMIGTGGEGHTFPGAVAPFGMVQFSPDTDTTCVIRDCYSHARGLSLRRSDDPGFSPDAFLGRRPFGSRRFPDDARRGDAVPLDPGDPAKPGSGYRSRFDHATEVARPGYYSVTLPDRGVRARADRGHADRRASLCLPRAASAAHLVLDLRSLAV